jgi:hypothetical protein
MADQTKFSNERLAQKIRWEGGLVAALEYGIRATDIEDPEVAKLWRRLERSFGTFSPLLDEASERLGVAA